MADYTVNIDIPDHKQGDRWEGMSIIGPITINGTTPAGALSRVRMQLRKGGNTYTLDSDGSTSPDAPISIDNAATWEASIAPVEGFLSATFGDWSWDMEFYQADKAGVLTLYKGVITVHPDVTKTA